MSGRWDEGRAAWERLTARRGDTSSEAALDDLDDVGAVRRLLDQIELDAVRTARRAGRAWAEIATRLGVSRQTAWERWRELDEDGRDRPVGAGAMAGAKAGTEVSTEAGSEASDDPIDAAAGVLTRAALARRRRSLVRVPNVVGRTWAVAREQLLAAGLDSIADDPATVSARPGSIVTDQSPEGEARVPPGTTVRLWVRDDEGGAGVREPLRPRPNPRSGRAVPELDR